MKKTSPPFSSTPATGGACCVSRVVVVAASPPFPFPFPFLFSFPFSLRAELVATTPKFPLTAPIWSCTVHSSRLLDELVSLPVLHGSDDVLPLWLLLGLSLTSVELLLLPRRPLLAPLLPPPLLLPLLLPPLLPLLESALQ